MVSDAANTSLPVVMVGDFNSNANGEPDLPDNTPTYSALIDAGFEDAWTVLNPGVTGNTCCQAPDLSNPTSDLSERIDLVLTRAGMGELVLRVGWRRDDLPFHAPLGF